MLQFVIVLVSFAGVALGGGSPVDYELSHLQSSRSYDYGRYGGKYIGKYKLISSGALEASGSESKAAGTALYGYDGGYGRAYGDGRGYAGHGHGYETPSLADYQVGYGATYYRKPLAHNHNAISPGIVLGQSLGVVHGATVGYKGLNSKGWVPIARPAVTKTAVYHETPIVPIVNDVLRHTAAKLGHSEGYALAGPAVGLGAHGYGGVGPVHGYVSAGPVNAHAHGHGYAAEAPVAGYAGVPLGGYASAGYAVAAVAPLVHQKPAEISITPSISYGYSYKLVPESVQLHPARLSGTVGIPLKGGYGGYSGSHAHAGGYTLPHSHY